MVKNLDRVNPVKREKVKRGMEFVERTNDGIVKQIILFGSSVTDDCTDESDIDLCLVSDNSDEQAFSDSKTFFSLFGGIPLETGDLCDIHVYGDLAGHVKDEIDAKGVVVYEY